MKLNPLKILFLDFDGVVNCSNLDIPLVYVTQDGKRHFDTFNLNLCSNVEKLIKELGLKVVISSTWRKTFDMISLRDIVNNQMKIDCEIIDYTTTYYLDKGYKDRVLEDPLTARSYDRGLQISHWLSEKKYTVEDYIVIDDDRDAGYGHEDKFIRVDNKVGFTEELLIQSLERFKHLKV